MSIQITNPVNTQVLIHHFSFCADGTQNLSFSADLGDGFRLNGYKAKAKIDESFKWRTADENNLSAKDGSHSVVFNVTIEVVDNSWHFTSIKRAVDNKDIIAKPVVNILALALAELKKGGAQ